MCNICFYKMAIFSLYFLPLLVSVDSEKEKLGLISLPAIIAKCAMANNE